MCIILSFLKSIQERAKLHILLLRQDEYCPTMEEKEALSFCPEYNNAQESHARHFFRFIIVILVLLFFLQDYGLLRTKKFCYHGNVT